MDVDQIIRELSEERKRLGRIIEALEKKGLEGVAARTRSTRGRKSMDAAARKEVSERMRRYWAMRRAANAFAAEPLARAGGNETLVV